MRRLEVSLGPDPVGQLREDDGGTCTFELYDHYRSLVPRPVLGQQFEDDLHRAYRGKQGRLPPYFLNLVPETGRLREVISEAAGIDPADDLALLEFTGEDLPGAVVVRAVEGESRPEATSARREEGDPQDAGKDSSELPADRLRFSLAGVQMKFSVLLADGKLTLPARGQAGDWIVKFPSPVFEGLPENELSMLEWARASDFDVPACALHTTNALEGFPRRFATAGKYVLAIRRYDRNEAGRIHQEDFAQVVGLPPSRKYDQITYDMLVYLCRELLGREGAEEAIRRLALVIATGNNDAHLKNWSLIYPDRVHPAWSPLYDQVSTVAWAETANLDRELSLKLGAVKPFGRLDRGALQRLARNAGLEPDHVIRVATATLADLRSTWARERAGWPLLEEHAAALRDHWQRVPLLREAGSLA